MTITEEQAEIIIGGISWMQNEGDLAASDALTDILRQIQKEFPNLAAQYPWLPFPSDEPISE